MKTEKIREFIHHINNLCHEKKIPVGVVDLDLLGEAAIQLSFFEKPISNSDYGNTAKSR